MNFTKRETSIMKGLAIMMMYVHHFYLSTDRFAQFTIDFFPLTTDITVYLARFLKICVAMFVFITGYGMMKSVSKGHQKEDITTGEMLAYTKKRLFSLLTGFIFIYIIVQIVCFPTGRFFDIYGKSGSSIIYVFLDMFGLAHLFQTPIFVGTWWYMSMCITMIVLFPLIYKLFQRYRWILLLGIVFVPRMLGLDMELDLLHWLLTLVLGMYCADTDFFSKLACFEKERFSKIPSWLLFVFHTLIMLALIVFRQSHAGLDLLDIFDAIIPVWVIYYSLKYIVNLPVVSTVLDFLGKHSMNMFLTHTLIRTTYFKPFSYGFGNAWLNILVFTLVTVAISMVLELLKKVLHFHEITNKLRTKWIL